MGPLQLVVPLWEVFGAGTCGRYLLHEFDRSGIVWWDRVPGDEGLIDEDTQKIVDRRHRALERDIDIALIQFGGVDLGVQSQFRGQPNVGYIFSENRPLTPEQVKGLMGFDVLVAGSEWNAQVIRETGRACMAVPQGVDSQRFRPMRAVREDDRFVIYSAGQWHHRKAQDLVIKAVRVAQQRHHDIWLHASWSNIWTQENGRAEAAGLRVVHLPILPHELLAREMNYTDLGLFPNRYEGGTNLLLMEYMACGKPVIANVSTGQADVMDRSAGIPIEGSDEDLVEQMIEGIEFFYHDRGALKAAGEGARWEMLNWPWSRTAVGIWEACTSVKSCDSIPT